MRTNKVLTERIIRTHLSAMCYFGILRWSKKLRTRRKIWLCWQKSRDGVIRLDKLNLTKFSLTLETLIWEKKLVKDSLIGTHKGHEVLGIWWAQPLNAQDTNWICSCDQKKVDLSFRKLFSKTFESESLYRWSDRKLNSKMSLIRARRWELLSLQVNSLKIRLQSQCREHLIAGLQVIIRRTRQQIRYNLAVIYRSSDFSVSSSNGTRGTLPNSS